MNIFIKANNMAKKQVAITGIGLLTCLGNDVASNWKRLLAGESGIAAIETFDASGFSTRFGGELHGFDPLEWMNGKEVRKCDKFIQYAMAAGIQALRDAGIDPHPEAAERYGVCVGSGIGGLGGIQETHLTYLNQGARRIPPSFVPGHIINMPAGYISMAYGLRGPSLACATACTTGTHMIGLGKRMIEYGEADVIVAGGSEAPISPLGLGGFCAPRALSTRNDDPAAASRPWDRDRDGFVLAEGAGIVILEELEHARARGARIYALLSGFGMSSDAHHVTAPPADGAGARQAMALALQDAGLQPQAIDYINAHGTSTPLGDIAELRAVKSLFGHHAEKLAISSSKSMIGHLLGASGSVEAAYCALALAEQIAPPTINLDNPDDECDLDLLPKLARPMPMHYALSNSFGFGGTNGSLVLARAP